jgi:2-hydroxychromene-2-carboxylate isomerase
VSEATGTRGPKGTNETPSERRETPPSGEDLSEHRTGTGTARQDLPRTDAGVPVLDFWFEFASTYSYVAALRVETAAETAGVAVRWQPFLLGPIFKEQGWDDSPFNLHPQKGRYMWRDVERLCAKYGIPFARPSRFPRNGLLAARVACLARSSSEPWLADFARAVFRANFAEDREIGDTVVVRSVLDSLDLPGEELIERSTAPENKGLLREQTRRAMELGIFGAPSFVANGELFWGNDRLEDALAWAKALGGTGSTP